MSTLRRGLLHQLPFQLASNSSTALLQHHLVPAVFNCCLTQTDSNCWLLLQAAMAFATYPQHQAVMNWTAQHGCLR